MISSSCRNIKRTILTHIIRYFIDVINLLIIQDMKKNIFFVYDAIIYLINSNSLSIIRFLLKHDASKDVYKMKMGIVYNVK